MESVTEHSSHGGDEITLTIPREESFHHVAHLVLAGMAARLDLTYENLDDLEVALTALLERTESNGDLTVKLRAREGAFEATVGPFHGDALKRELARDVEEEVGLNRVLQTVVDKVQLEEEDGEQWVELTKRLGPAGSRK
jgi:anti-sigma regulatory factor (Ser/Thr protein kinase)